MYSFQIALNVKNKKPFKFPITINKKKINNVKIGNNNKRENFKQRNIKVVKHLNNENSFFSTFNIFDTEYSYQLIQFSNFIILKQYYQTSPRIVFRQQ